MKIVICESISAYKKMSELFDILTNNGHSVIMPSLDNIDKELDENGNSRETSTIKKENDLIRKYFEHIDKSDSILVVNQPKNGIEGYIGANTFLEIGFAHVLNKTIFILNQYSNELAFSDEINAMDTIILNGNVNDISSK